MQFRCSVVLFSCILGNNAAQAFVPTSHIADSDVTRMTQKTCGPCGGRSYRSPRLTLHSDVSLPGTTTSTETQLQESMLDTSSIISRFSSIGGEDLLPTPADGIGSPMDKNDSCSSSLSTVVVLPRGVQESDPLVVSEEEQRTYGFSSPELEVWIRRLVTREDAFHLHKIFGISYLISSSVLLITAVYNNIVGYPDIPAFSETFLQIFAFSGLVVTASSVRLAVKHRRNEIPARNLFISSAISSLFNVFVGTWASPFAPSILMNDMVNRCCFAAFAIVGVAGVVDIIVTTGDVLEGKRSKYDAVEVTPMQYVSEYFNYIVPVLWGLPFFIAVGWLFSVQHDRQWYLDLCAAGPPGLMAQSVYVNVASSAANNWGVLAVTLRDKKLIGKDLEMFIISAASMPALLYNAVGLSEFYAAVQETQI